MYNELKKKLLLVYPDCDIEGIIRSIDDIVKNYKDRLKYNNQDKFEIDSGDIALISYASSVVSKDKQKPALKVLKEFIQNFNIDEYFNTLHILPFYPWDTDRGFSVKDYYKVDKRYGTWKEIKGLASVINLMFDFVANHASIDNPLVQKSLIESVLSKRDKRYEKYRKYKSFVISFADKNKPGKKSLSKLARPRPNPVLTKYIIFENSNTKKLKAILGTRKDIIDKNVKILGQGWVWTTFSRPKNKEGKEETRQVDLNFKNPTLLLEVIKILLSYVEKGCGLIRLDAVGYIWKKLNSSSLHEKGAHIIIQILQLVLKSICPGIITIAEVNEPQDKCITYLGNFKNEADLIYQFAHFPLVLYSLHFENTEPYKRWLKTLGKIKGRQFITILGSHDGLGLKPVRGFLGEKQIDKLVNHLVDKHKALPNFASLPGGKKIVYEICATPWNLINPPDSKQDMNLQVDRYLLTVALGLMIKGIPAFYFNGLFGSENYIPEDGLDENRTINREVCDFDKLKLELTDKKNHMYKVMKGIKKLLGIRKSESAFNPSNPFGEVINVGNSKVIVVYLKDNIKNDDIYGVFNFSRKIQNTKIKINNKKFMDLMNKQTFERESDILELDLEPYQYLYLKRIN